MPEPVGKAWQRLVQQIMAEQQAEAASKLDLQLPRVIALKGCAPEEERKREMWLATSRQMGQQMVL